MRNLPCPPVNRRGEIAVAFVAMQHSCIATKAADAGQRRCCMPDERVAVAYAAKVMACSVRAVQRVTACGLLRNALILFV